MKTSAIALALGFACLLTAPALAQGPEDVVQEFQRYFRKFKTIEEKVEAVRTLEDAEAPVGVDALIDLFGYKDPQVVQTAQEVLSGFKDPAAFEPSITGLVERKDSVEKALLIQCLGDAKQKQAVPVILGVLAEGKPALETRFQCVTALGKLGAGDDAAAVIGPLLEDKEVLVRMAAAQAVGKLRIAPLGEALIPMLEDDAWQVQSAAVQALGLVRVQAALDPLVDRMEKGGRIEVECAEALFLTTGTDLGTDVKSWRRQLKGWRRISGWRIPTDAELEKARASRRKNDLLYGKKEGTPTFGGIPTTSESVLFVIDVSGSMDDVVVETEKFSGYEDLRKLTIVQTELARTIRSLPKTTRFNIIAFASDTDTWKKKLSPANVVNKKSAESWVLKLKPIGGSESTDVTAGKTNTFKALMSVFGIDPEAKKQPDVEDLGEMAAGNTIDTVYFLSDGRPSVGKLTNTQHITDEVRRVNGRFGITIHTISIGQFSNGFLKTLSVQSGGIFVDLGR